MTGPSDGNEHPGKLDPQHAGNEGLRDRGPGTRDPLEASLPYVVPYALFALFTLAADYTPQWRSLVYAVKTIVVAGALWHYRRDYAELRFRPSPATIGAVFIGIAVIVVWVGVDPYYPQSGAEWSALFKDGLQRFEHSAKVEGQFNPFSGQYVLPPAAAILFRLIGAVLVVPVFEELFVRSWLLRLLIKVDFESVPMGAFSWGSFAGTVLLFGLSHHEWLAGIVCGVAFNLLLYWRKDLFQCVVAHAAANLALAAWVLSQGAWHFW